MEDVCSNEWNFDLGRIMLVQDYEYYAKLERTKGYSTKGFGMGLYYGDQYYGDYGQPYWSDPGWSDSGFDMMERLTFGDRGPQYSGREFAGLCNREFDGQSDIIMKFGYILNPTTVKKEPFV